MIRSASSADGVTWKERFFRLWAAEGAAGSREAFDPVFYAADDALVGAIPRTLSFEDTVRRLTAGIGDVLAVREASVIERVAREAAERAPGDLWSFTPGQDIQGMLHERMDARLFRS